MSIQAVHSEKGIEVHVLPHNVALVTQQHVRQQRLIISYGTPIMQAHRRLSCGAPLQVNPIPQTPASNLPPNTGKRLGPHAAACARATEKSTTRVRKTQQPPIPAVHMLQPQLPITKPYCS